MTIYEEIAQQLYYKYYNYYCTVFFDFIKDKTKAEKIANNFINLTIEQLENRIRQNKSIALQIGGNDE